MKLFLFGIGHMAEELLNKIGIFPPNVEILGFIDNNPDKRGKSFYGKPVYSPQKLHEMEFDVLIVMSDKYFEDIKEDLIYWHKIEAKKIKTKIFLLQILLEEKYRNTEDREIQEIIQYWEENEINEFNQYVKLGEEKHFVQWDHIENMPYIMFEDKKMYFPYDYKFEEYDGRKVVFDIMAEQQQTSPHLYIKDEIKIDRGDVIVDAGVQEGNFSLRYIEKVSKAYLFECDNRWIRPLQKTFEKFKEKVVLYNGYLGQFRGSNYLNLDETITGRLDFLKMDIEGAEIEALLGGKELLMNNDVKCSICSYHKSGDERAIRDILHSYGYKTDTSDGYMVFYWDRNIYATLDFRRGIVYARK